MSLAFINNNQELPRGVFIYFVFVIIMAQLKTVKNQFKAKYQILYDYAGHITENSDKPIVSVARRAFANIYPQFISAYEIIIGSLSGDDSDQEVESYREQFKEINRLYLTLDQLAESDQGNARTARHTQVSLAKLPAIELPKFSGQVLEWLPFYDLFMSLVDKRDISDAEKHYYLRSSLVGEPLTMVRQLPVDDSNYSVALKLLQDRYHNSRCLLDTYISSIVKLPVVSNQSSLRSVLYDPLSEAVQALEKLKQPVREWSYLLLYLVFQKLPTRIREMFEERYGKDPAVLPTIFQLLELLEEQCRVHQAVSPEPARSPRVATEPRGRQRPSTPPRAARVHTASQGHQVVQNLSCSFCNAQSHSLYRCEDFLKLTPLERKRWAKKSGYCFRCLRKHYVRDCQHRNWCAHCRSSEHNSLLCTEGNIQRSQAWSGGQARQVSSQPRPHTPPRHNSSPGPGRSSPRPGRSSPRPGCSSPVPGRSSPRHASVQAVSQGQRGDRGGHPARLSPAPEPRRPVQVELSSREELELPSTSHSSRPRVGDRVRQAQAFSALRFGSRSSHEEPL